MDVSWKLKANCRGLDPNMFIPPEDGGHRSVWLVQQARRVCATCEVKDECLVYGSRPVKIYRRTTHEIPDSDLMEDGQVQDNTIHMVGVWGGTSTTERVGKRGEPEQEVCL